MMALSTTRLKREILLRKLLLPFRMRVLFTYSDGSVRLRLINGRKAWPISLGKRFGGFGMELTVPMGEEGE